MSTKARTKLSIVRRSLTKTETKKHLNMSECVSQEATYQNGIPDTLTISWNSFGKNATLNNAGGDKVSGSGNFPDFGKFPLMTL